MHANTRSFTLRARCLRSRCESDTPRSRHSVTNPSLSETEEIEAQCGFPDRGRLLWSPESKSRWPAAVARRKNIRYISGRALPLRKLEKQKAFPSRLATNIGSLSQTGPTCPCCQPIPAGLVPHCEAPIANSLRPLTACQLPAPLRASRLAARPRAHWQIFPVPATPQLRLTPDACVRPPPWGF